MLRKTIFAAVALAALPTWATAQTTSTPDAAPAAVAPAPTKYSTTESKIGDLLDNPTTKAVLDKDLPGLSTNENIGMARGMTLKEVQQFAPDKITDERLALVDTDFGKLGK